MAWQLYIVSRDQPLIYGYLQVALEQRRPDSFEIIFDRRRAESATGPPVGPDRRRNGTVDDALREHGYAVVSVRGRRSGADVAARAGDGAGALWRRAPAWSLAAAVLVVILAGAGAVAVLVSGQRDEDPAVPIMTALPDRVAEWQVERPTEASSAAEPEPLAGPMAVRADASARRDEPVPLSSAPGDQAGPPQPAVLVSPAEPSKPQTRSTPPAEQRKNAVQRKAEEPGSPAPASRPSEPRPSGPRSRQAQAAAAPSAQGETPEQENGPPGPPRVEVLKAAGAGSRALTIRLSDEDGHPVADAQVWVVGRAADGSELQSPLTPASALGLYRGSLPPLASPAQLMLRVTVRASRFEVSVPR